MVIIVNEIQIVTLKTYVNYLVSVGEDMCLLFDLNIDTFENSFTPSTSR